MDLGSSPIVITLQEIKCSNILLGKRLRTIDKRREWFHSQHDEGKGGVAVGILNAFASRVYDKQVGRDWVSISFKLKGVDMTVLAVYALTHAMQERSYGTILIAIIIT